ncbi:HET-domain-containing protein [Thozetella sp. PMI_491]|nr:HET-domain-containing protein [Thozetella sp. PMI_491]
MKGTSSTSHQATRCGARVPERLPSKLPENVPLTIQDAIQVTRDLGYSCLWVDKYCINQEDEEEKLQQCSRMGDIYSGSDLTIFALGDDAEYGLPGVSSRRRLRLPPRTTVGGYEFVSTLPDPHFCIEQAKWSTRGWTYQEGLFSTRCLFFTDYQVYFECNAMNCVEIFKSNLKTLHIRSGKRFRAYLRAGRFVCGNSNEYSHLDVRKNMANHRKIDIIRRCLDQTQQYTKRELTNEDDILNAYTGIARFYARTSANIASLSGLAIPYPIARLWNMKQEQLDYLSYALAWAHHVNILDDPNGNIRKSATRGEIPWNPRSNPRPQRRLKFPSWSWTGWFGELEGRTDFPYCWTSHLSSVEIGFQGGATEDYTFLQRTEQYTKLLTAKTLHFDAHVLNPKELYVWERRELMSFRKIPSISIRAYLSMGPYSMKGLLKSLLEGELECLVLGTHGNPREDVFRSIIAADGKSKDADQGRIQLLECEEHDAIVCLIVSTVNQRSCRRGILKIEFKGVEEERAARGFYAGPKKRFTLE